MIVKILSSASKDFHGVKYNDKKINKGTGELMLMKNFPSAFDKDSTQNEVRDYLKSISNTNKVKKPQFHAVISTKNQEHSKEQLTNLANDFMKEMGYEKQPFIVVFHNDTENNHVHIVSTRVNKETGLKINDSYEKLKSQRALNKAMEKNFNIKLEERLNDLMKYKFSNYQQFEKLLTRKGFKVAIDDKNRIEILKNGDKQKTLNLDKLKFSDNYQKDNRSVQLKQILLKYKDVYSNEVFKVEDNRKAEGLYQNENKETQAKLSFEYESELQQKLRDVFGVDIVFHFKDDKKPFGYTLIDNATQKVYKGSDIVKMNDIFQFTDDKINKRDFERIKSYNLKGSSEKKILYDFLKKENADLKEYMLFDNKKKNLNKDNFKELRKEVRDYIINQNLNIDSLEARKEDNLYQNTNFHKDENGDWYVNHQRYHHIIKLEHLLGEKDYSKFLEGNLKNYTPKAKNDTSNLDTEAKIISNLVKEMANIADEVFNELEKSNYTEKDNTEDNYRKKKKRKKRRR